MAIEAGGMRHLLNPFGATILSFIKNENIPDINYLPLEKTQKIYVKPYLSYKKLQTLYSINDYSAAISILSTFAAQNLNSGILPKGSNCGFVKIFAAASLKQKGINIIPSGNCQSCLTATDT